VQRDHRKAENIFPKEGGGEKVLTKNDFFPNRPGHHDEIQKAGLDQD